MILTLNPSRPVSTIEQVECELNKVRLQLEQDPNDMYLQIKLKQLEHDYMELLD